jgi:hypothetical protein
MTEEKRHLPPGCETSRLPAWMNEKLDLALLRVASIYGAGVTELKAIQAEALRTKPKLSKEQYWKRIGTLNAKIDARFAEEVGPLVSGRELPTLNGSDAFYGVAFAAMDELIKNPADGSLELLALTAGLMEFDAEHRFHTPLKVIRDQDFVGDRRSTDKFLQLEANRERVRYDEGLPPFKGNIDHRILMKYGLGYGLENATAEELAEFFDFFCPCEADSHDESDLRKLRKRILTEAARARERATPKYSGRNQRVI